MTESQATPDAFLAYQKAWVADRAQLKVIEKSRRTGVTWAEAADNVLTAAATKSAGGQNVYYIAYNQDMTVEYIEACAMWARAFNHAATEVAEEMWHDADEDKFIKTFVIRFPQSGHRIVALTSRPSNLRGRQGVVVIDEAAFHEQLDELLKAALALLIWGGAVHVISTHNGDDNPFNELVNDIRAGKRKGKVHRIVFREAVAAGLYQRVCLRTGKPWNADEEKTWVDSVYAFYGDGADEELDCIPSNGSGAFLSANLLDMRSSDAVPVLRLTCPKGFETWSEEARFLHINDWLEEHALPVLDTLPKDGVESYYGQDFARNADLSVQWFLLKLQNMRYRCPFVLEMANVPFESQKQVLFFIIDRLPHFRRGEHDARGNGQYLAEVAQMKYGTARIGAVMLSEGWYRDHMPGFKAALQDGDLEFIPKDKDINNDHRALKLIKGVGRLPETRTKGQSGNKRHGDSAIAHVLAYAATRNPAAPIEFMAVPRRASEGNYSRLGADDDDDTFVAEGDGAW